MIRFSGHSSWAEPIPPGPCASPRRRRVGQADDREPGQAAVDVRLDLDAARLEADERVSDGAREHTVDARDTPVTGGERVCANIPAWTRRRRPRWAETWTRAWPAGDTDAIAALYADEATYRALAFREPDLGLAGVRGCSSRTSRSRP